MGALRADIKPGGSTLADLEALLQTGGMKETIWQIVAAIPRGRVATYGQVARLAGYPSHARYVGAILKNLPAGSTLPWHRVVNGRGRLSFPPGSASWQRQKDRLEAEGVVFTGSGFSLKTFQWPV